MKRRRKSGAGLGLPDAEHHTRALEALDMVDRALHGAKAAISTGRCHDAYGKLRMATANLASFSSHAASTQNAPRWPFSHERTKTALDKRFLAKCVLTKSRS